MFLSAVSEAVNLAMRSVRYPEGLVRADKNVRPTGARRTDVDCGIAPHPRPLPRATARFAEVAHMAPLGEGVIR